MHSIFFGEGSHVEVSSDQEGFQGAWYIATVVTQPCTKGKTSNTQYVVRYHTLFSKEDGTIPLLETVQSSFLRPRPPFSDFDLALNKVVDAFHRDGWWTGVITGVVEEEAKYMVFFQYPPETIAFSRPELRQHHHWLDGKWVLAENQEHLQHGCKDDKNAERALQSPIQHGSMTRSASQHASATKSASQHASMTKKRHVISELEGGGSSQKKRGGRPPKLLPQKKIDQVEGENHNWAKEAVLEMITEDCTVGTGFSAFSGMGSSFGKFPFQLPTENKPRVACLHDPPRDTEIGCPTPKMTLTKNNKELGSKVVKVEQVNETESEIEMIPPTTLGVEDAVRRETTGVSQMVSVTENTAVLAVDNLQENGLKDQSVTNAQTVDDSSVEDADKREASHVSHTVSVTNDAAVVPLQENGLKDQVVFMLNGTNAPTPTVDGSIYLEKTVSSYTEEDKIPSLPFVRHSPLWEQIECMPVFKNFPQKPHFQPLANSNAESREGLAIGKMVIFANVVDSVLKVKIGHPKSVSNSCMQTLLELETHGFDIRPVKGYLNELLLKKEKIDQLEEDSKQFQMKITKQNMEKMEIDGKIRSTEDQIKVLEEEIKVLQEVLASTMPTKEMKDDEIVKLETNWEVTIEALKNAKLEFENLAHPWLD